MQTAARYRAWPRWARIAAAVAVVALALAVVSAATENSDADKAATAEVLGLTMTTIPDAASSAYLERPASEIPPNEPPISDEPSARTTTAAGATTVAPSRTSKSDCHPSYDPCVPHASDVDCTGGSGNGPAYTGRVNVIGPDVYDLDSDGNGVGCE